MFVVLISGQYFQTRASTHEKAMELALGAKDFENAQNGLFYLVYIASMYKKVI